jgi:RNA polymerase sigma-70 factor (ECF subfamily)
VCGLSTSQIAAAFVVPTSTMAKRLVRAKATIRAAAVPFTVPARTDLPDRCAEVLKAIYLIFTAGHTSPDGPALVRGDLCDEARWLAQLLADLLEALPRPTGRDGQDHEQTVARAEALGLLALMLFTDSRRVTRLDGSGRLVLLEHADRSRWDRAMIAQGQAALARALALGHVGAYQLEAAIAGVHTTATTWHHTDWAAIVELYDRLVQLEPTDVVRLNRAVAVSMVAGPQAGLTAVDEVAAAGGLTDYRYLHAARGDLLRRLGRSAEAARAYRQALALGGNEAEQRFLAERLASCSPPSTATA